MKNRCDAGTDPDYAGIQYDPRWAAFKNFYADMGPRPKGMSLHRKVSLGHYNKSNCKWADDYEQANNKKDTVYEAFPAPNGISLSVPEWARKPRPHR